MKTVNRYALCGFVAANALVCIQFQIPALADSGEIFDIKMVVEQQPPSKAELASLNKAVNELVTMSTETGNEREIIKQIRKLAGLYARIDKFVAFPEPEKISNSWGALIHPEPAGTIVAKILPSMKTRLMSFCMAEARNTKNAYGEDLQRLSDFYRSHKLTRDALHFNQVVIDNPDIFRYEDVSYAYFSQMRIYERAKNDKAIKSVREAQLRYVQSQLATYPDLLLNIAEMHLALGQDRQAFDAFNSYFCRHPQLKVRMEMVPYHELLKKFGYQREGELLNKAWQVTNGRGPINRWPGNFERTANLVKNDPCVARYVAADVLSYFKLDSLPECGELPTPAYQIEGARYTPQPVGQ